MQAFVELHCNKLEKLLVSHEGMGNGHVVPLENGARPSNGILTLSRPKCAIVVQQRHPTNMLKHTNVIKTLRDSCPAMASYKHAECSAQQFTAQQS